MSMDIFNSQWYGIYLSLDEVKPFEHDFKNGFIEDHITDKIDNIVQKIDKSFSSTNDREAIIEGKTIGYIAGIEITYLEGKNRINAVNKVKKNYKKIIEALNEHIKVAKDTKLDKFHCTSISV